MSEEPPDSSITQDGEPATTTGRIGEDRDRTAEDRDQRAEQHDQASEARDVRAAARDQRAEAREQAANTFDEGAAADRAGALRDRKGGASDRVQAADDRLAASGDRLLSARDRSNFSVDDLTGAYRRDPGLVALAREIEKAQRTRQPFVLAFVDVDSLKATNDSHGHAAGDQRLRETAEAIRGRLRSYDLIIRFGGDEFVCALPDLTMVEAAERFALIEADLMAANQRITVGMAEVESDDALEDLIARADAVMYSKRKQQRSADG